MRGQITAAEDCIRALKTQLADAQLAHKKLANKSSRTEANIRAEMVATEELLDAKKVRIV